MKKIVSYFLSVILLTSLFSCGDDSVSPPIAEIFYEVDGDNPYMFNFSTKDENVVSYSWNFGDETSSIESQPTHIYEMSGNYTVTLTAKGEGGEVIATKQIGISASLEEMLSGGSSFANGKTWVMSTTANSGTDGVSNKVIETMTGADVEFPATDNLLTVIGLGAEYDNLFSFKYDGSYSINLVNDNCVAGYLYSVMQGLNMTTITDYGLVQSELTTPTAANWTLEEGVDLDIDAVTDLGNDNFEEVTVTFNDVDVITFNNGGFIGFLDYTNKAIIREITPNRISLTLFLHGVLQHPDKPSNMVTATFDAQ